MQETQNQPVSTEKLEQIKDWVTRQVDIPYTDAQWLLDELEKEKAKVSETLATQEKERKVLKLLVEFENRARHVLTLWLAFRGSMDEDMFKATQQLGQQTVGALNGK